MLVLDPVSCERLEAACAAAGTRISRTYSSTVSEVHTPRLVASRDNLTIGYTPPARIVHRGHSQMSPPEAELAPVVTPEQLMVSLEELDSEVGQATRRRTSSASRHIA